MEGSQAHAAYTCFVDAWSRNWPPAPQSAIAAAPPLCPRNGLLEGPLVMMYPKHAHNRPFTPATGAGTAEECGSSRVGEAGRDQLREFRALAYGHPAIELAQIGDRVLTERRVLQVAIRPKLRCYG